MQILTLHWQSSYVFLCQHLENCPLTREFLISKCYVRVLVLILSAISAHSGPGCKGQISPELQSSGPSLCQGGRERGGGILCSSPAQLSVKISGVLVNTRILLSWPTYFRQNSSHYHIPGRACGDELIWGHHRAWCLPGGKTQSPSLISDGLPASDWS